MTDLETAILIIPPLEVHRFAYPLAKQYAARMLELYPIHLTLLWPWVPINQLDEGCTRLADLAKTLTPVPVTLDGYESLGRAECMRVTNPDPLTALFKQVFAAFPDCPPYYGAFADVIHPHLSIGMFKKSEARPTFPPYDSFTFTLDRLHVYYGPRADRIPWLVHQVIMLQST